MNKKSFFFSTAYERNSMRISRPFLYTILFLMLFPLLGSAQVGINTTDIDFSAILEIESADKGVLFPSLTLAQRDLVSSPADGLTIYCNDCCLNNGTGALYYYNGADWKSLDSTCSESLAPPCIPTTTTMNNSDHTDNPFSATKLLVFDGFLTNATQPDVGDLRMHHNGGKDIWEFAFGTDILLPGYQIVLYWTDYEKPGDLGLVVKLFNGGSTSQPTEDTLTPSLPNGNNAVNGGDDDYILTIDVVADTDNITVQSYGTSPRGKHPSLLEIVILDSNGDVIPFTCN